MLDRPQVDRQDLRLLSSGQANEELTVRRLRHRIYNNDNLPVQARCVGQTDELSLHVLIEPTIRKPQVHRQDVRLLPSGQANAELTVRRLRHRIYNDDNLPVQLRCVDQTDELSLHTFSDPTDINALLFVAMVVVAMVVVAMVVAAMVVVAMV